MPVAGCGAELSDHLGYEKGDPSGRGTGNSRNGHSGKTVLTEDGEVELAVPRDRTRLSALGMFIMTMVIQFFVFPDAWLGQHMFWASLLFAVMVLGPGQISLDRVFFRR